MATKTIRDISLLWESLGTFWGQFPDKALFTKIWETYNDVVQKLITRKARVQLSRFLETLRPILEYTDFSYHPIFDGNNRNTITISGLHAYPIDNYVFSIPTLSGIETNQVLIEGTNYQLYKKNHIQFLSDPQYDTTNSGIEKTITLYADDIYRHNPVLWEIYASGIGLLISSLDAEDYLPYKSISISGIQRTKDIADHYKYLIWGLSEIKKRSPTIQTLKTGYGISRGLAFAYRAGTIDSITSNTVKISVSGLTNTYDSYVIPSGYNPSVLVGNVVDKFDVLISGINFYDHVNNYDYIIALSGVNDFNYTSQGVFTYNSNLNNLNYNSDFHDKYVKSLIPKGLNFQSRME